MFSIPVGYLYRPNAAKVKNLKSKDYLGKSRLIAQSDRNQGVEHQWAPMVIDKAALESREGVSFAATNLVRKNLTSRTRQQSEPPLNRTVFPPTPPPDDRSTSNGSTTGGPSHHRSSSLRIARPPRLELDRTGASLDRRPGPQEITPAEKPRIGTTRTASEPRGPPPLHQNMRGLGQEPSRGGWAHELPGGHRRNLSDTTFPTQSEYGNADPYSTYSSPQSLANAGWGRGSRHQPPQFINEEDEYGSDVCDGKPLSDGAFEIVGTAPGGPGSSPIQQRRTRSPARYSRRANSRRPEVRRFRTKVHAPDDIRYIMIESTAEFAEFETRIREKFGFQHPLKMKVQDDGDMITMVDQEDLDLLLSSAREMARREGSEMGKMEVSLVVLIIL